MGTPSKTIAALTEGFGSLFIRELHRKVGVGRAGRAIRAGTWSGMGYIASQALRMLATLVLTRLLAGPEAFGAIGLVGVFLAGLAMFSELGITANVVQHARGDDPQFLNTAYSIQVMRGAAIWLIAVGAAYPLSLFYRQPEIMPLLVVAGLSELIRGLASTAACTLTRHVNLRDITLLTVGSEFVAAAVSIGWAMVAPSPWALVVRTVVSAIIYAGGSHFIARPRVQFEWDRASARDLLHFGGWVSLSTAAYFLSGQGERLILGKFITLAELGCFSLAVMIVSMPGGGINQLVNQIFLPILSQSVRTGEAATIKDFTRARRVFAALAGCAALGFLVFGRPFVTLLLPSKYAMAGWMVQALGIKVALDIFAAPATTVILARGKSAYSAYASCLRLVVMVAGLGITIKYFGIQQAVISLLVAQAISYFPVIFGVSTMLPGVAKAELKWYGGFLCLLCMAAFVPWP
jgi:O-antigen/teichoic acid export membrane protein